MGKLFGVLRKRVDANARRAVDVYTEELVEYRTMAADTRSRATMLDFAVLLRRRTVALAADNQPFTGDDLGYLEVMGRDRGEAGVSLASQRRVLALHAALTLQEIYEVVGPNDLDDLQYVLAWLGPQGAAAQDAFTRGFLDGQKRIAPMVTRVQQLAKMLLTDDAAARTLARNLGGTVADHYLVTVVRIADGPARPQNGARDEIITALLHRGEPPAASLTPVTWHEPHELVLLVPSAAPHALDAQAVAADRALSLVRDFAEMVGRPCSAGAAHGAVPGLAAAVTLARQVSRAAPVQSIPKSIHTVADVFVELGVAQLPQVDDWLRAVARRLSSGPDLVATLDAYYRNDMNRLHAAASLHVHPRTLDYRLRRVRDLTGVDPTSTYGIRVLNTTVARILAGAWPDQD
jgi:hypothetical protein